MNFEFNRPKDGIKRIKDKEKRRRSDKRKIDRSNIFLDSRNINEDELLAEMTPLKPRNPVRDVERSVSAPTMVTTATASVQSTSSIQSTYSITAKPKTPIPVKERRFFQRYVEWKNQARKDNIVKEKKPFVTSVRSDFAFTSKSFKPPSNLKDPRNIRVSFLFIGP